MREIRKRVREIKERDQTEIRQRVREIKERERERERAREHERVRTVSRFVLDVKSGSGGVTTDTGEE